MFHATFSERNGEFNKQILLENPDEEKFCFIFPILGLYQLGKEAETGPS